MAAAYPIWELLSPSPEAGLVSTEDMLATIITSIPSRIQATPKDETTRVCHRLHGSRSILAGTWVSIVLVSLITHLPRFLLDLRWCPSLCVASSVGNPNLQNYVLAICSKPACLKLAGSTCVKGRIGRVFPAPPTPDNAQDS